MYQTKRIDLVEKTKPNNKSMSLITRDTLINTNLESYKKALTNIVGKMSRTPSAENVSRPKSIERKPSNPPNYPVYNINVLNNNVSSKYFINSSFNETSSNTPNLTKHKRSSSNEKLTQKRDLLNRSAFDTFTRNDVFQKRMNRSMSTNKIPRENTEERDINTSTLKIDPANHSNINLTFLQDNGITNPDTEDEQGLRELIHKYQLRDAIHRQEINKLTKANELLRTHIKNLEKEMEKIKKNRELEAKYLARLESEIAMLKNKEKERERDKNRSTSVERKQAADSKDIKVIEELNKRIANITAEKKLVEDLLKNTLLQNEIQKKKSERPPSASITTHPNAILASIDLNSLKPTNENLNIKSTKNNHGYSKSIDHSQTSQISPNDNSIHMGHPIHSGSIHSHSAHTGKEEEVIVNDIFTNNSMTQSKIKQMIDENQDTPIDDDDDESCRNFSNRVHMPVPTVSLKDKLDMSQFKLDLSRLKIKN